MQVEVVRPDDLGPSEAALWTKFQETSASTLSPFLSLTFAQAVGRSRPTARVAVIQEDGSIEGFLPFEVGQHRIARPMGWPMNDVQGFIGSGNPIDAGAAVRKSGLRAWTFDNVPTSQSALVPYYYRGATFQSQFADLRGSYDSYLESRNKSVRIGVTRKRRALERDVGEVSFEWNSSNPEHFQQLEAWKSLQYASTGVTGLYDVFSDPSSVRIQKELAAAVDHNCRGVTNVLMVDGQLIAIHLGLLGPRGLSAWFPAFNTEFSRFSPGLLLWFTIAQDSIERGITRIDFGGGDEGYKHQLATGSFELARGCVWANRAENAGRTISRRIIYDTSGRVRGSTFARSLRGAQRT